jgi:DNA-binding CsgD family transcriptional regulator
LVEAAVHLGRHDEAKRHVDAARMARLSELSPRLEMHIRAAAALVAPASASIALFTEALAVPGGRDTPFDHARVQMLFGERLRRTRATGDARPVLSESKETFHWLGARPWEERAEIELRATGATRRRNNSEAVLTPQERETALLAAAGLSNKEIGERLFMSPRTVSSHLYKVFPKLGITKRSALRDALTDDASAEIS